MFNYNSIASKLLFTSFDNSLKIIFGGETLNCSQSFTTISLLNSNVYQTILNWATFAEIVLGDGRSFSGSNYHFWAIFKSVRNQ